MSMRSPYSRRRRSSALTEAVVSFLSFMAIMPVLALVSAWIYGFVLFWPTMLMFGALHTWIPWVPALAWQSSLLVVALLYLLIPTGSNSSKDD